MAGGAVGEDDTCSWLSLALPANCHGRPSWSAAAAGGGPRVNIRSWRSSGSLARISPETVDPYGWVGLSVLIPAHGAPANG